MLSDNIADIDINILCEDADRFFKANQYEKAKEKYANALTIKPNKKTDFINGKIKQIADFQQFLLDRFVDTRKQNGISGARYHFLKHFLKIMR